MALRNMTGEVLRFINAANEITQTLEPEETVVERYGPEEVEVVDGIRYRTIRPFAFVGLPPTGNDTIFVKRDTVRNLCLKGKGRTKVYEPEDPVLIEGILCYRGARKYVE